MTYLVHLRDKSDPIQVKGATHHIKGLFHLTFLSLKSLTDWPPKIIAEFKADSVMGYGIVPGDGE